MAVHSKYEWIRRIYGTISMQIENNLNVQACSSFVHEIN
jgi:hypothetical protein